MPDTDDPQMPGKVGLQCVGGIVNHLGALTRTRLLYSELIPPSLGYGILGAGFCGLGLSEPYDGFACIGSRTCFDIVRSTPW